MLWTLVAKELRESLLSLKLQIAFVAACALAAIGSVLLVADCQRPWVTTRSGLRLMPGCWTSSTTRCSPTGRWPTCQ